MNIDTPRGVRNNNPGNVRFDGTHWQGLTGNDGTFCIFDTPENGIRAMARIVRNYGKRGIHTISAIVSTWAPPSENNTAAYIKAVCDQCSVQGDATLTDDLFPDLIAAIIEHENGEQPYTMDQIKAGIEASV